MSSPLLARRAAALFAVRIVGVALLSIVGMGGCHDATAPAAERAVPLSPATATVAWGDTLRLAIPAGTAGGAAVAWSSSDTSVLRVDATGLATALRGGTARVTARASGAVALLATGDVTVEARFTVVSAGRNASCGIVPSGALLCWGAVTDSQRGTVVSVTSPTAAPAIARGRFREVHVTRGGPVTFDASAPSAVVCATRVTAETLCWGFGNQGELGKGPLFGGLQPPAPLATAVQFAAFSVGFGHVCALTADGVPWCWGSFLFDDIVSDARCTGGGSPGHACRTVPGVLSATVRLREIAAGADVTCGIALDARLWCDGIGTAAGRAIDGVNTATPLHPLDGDAYATVTVGNQTACAITTAGELRCWGRNPNGALGRGTVDTLSTPVPAPVQSTERFSRVSAGDGFACALTTDGRAFCWGANSWGQLGDGTATDRAVPTLVATSRRFAIVSAGTTHACAVADDGAAFCWGDNRAGALGNGVTLASSVPVRVAAPR